MKITKLPGSADLSLPQSTDEGKALANAIKELEKLINEDFKEIPSKATSSTDIPCEYPIIDKNCEGDNCCMLEWFYYFDASIIKTPPDYKNAIWIRINCDDSRWIYVHINKHCRKKAILFTEKDLKCPAFKQFVGGLFKLPHSFTTPAYYERKRVAKMAYSVLMNEIMRRLPCIC